MAHSRAEESVYVITFFGQFKGKGNGGPEAPKLRSDYRAETLVREKEIDPKRFFFLIALNWCNLEKKKTQFNPLNILCFK